MLFTRNVCNGVMCTFGLVVGNTLLNFDNVLVEAGALPHVGQVGEYERLLRVEAKRDDVLQIK